MGSMSIWHWLIVAFIVLLLFGSGRVSSLMGEMAKGVKAFKKGLEEEPAPTETPKAVDGGGAPESAKTASKDHTSHT